MPAPISPLITGGQPSQGTQNLQNIQANRIKQSIQEKGATNRAQIQAGTQRSGQRSQERMAQTQEQGATQRSDAQIAAGIRAKEEDREFTEKMTKMNAQMQKDRDEIQWNQTKAIAEKDFKSAEKWRERNMEFSKEMFDAQMGQNAMNMEMMYSLIDQQAGELESQARKDLAFNETSTRNDNDRKLAADHTESIRLRANKSVDLSPPKDFETKFPKKVRVGSGNPLDPMGSSRYSTVTTTEQRKGSYVGEYYSTHSAKYFFDEVAEGSANVTADVLSGRTGNLDDVASGWDFKEFQATNDVLNTLRDDFGKALRETDDGDTNRVEFLQSQLMELDKYKINLGALRKSKTPMAGDKNQRTIGQQYGIWEARQISSSAGARMELQTNEGRDAARRSSRYLNDFGINGAIEQNSGVVGSDAMLQQLQALPEGPQKDRALLALQGLSSQR